MEQNTLQTQENSVTAIRNLQTYLRQISYFDPNITPPPIDGIFGSDTRQSLSDFQRLQGLPVTGVADRRTWDELYAAYRFSLSQNTIPRRVAFFPDLPKDYTLSPGSEHFSVSVLQFMLRELEVKYGSWGELTISGVFDDPTVQAVRRFQMQNGLPESGTVGRTTWNAVADQYNSMFEGPQRE